MCGLYVQHSNAHVRVHALFGQWNVDIVIDKRVQQCLTCSALHGTCACHDALLTMSKHYVHVGVGVGVET